MWMTREGAGKQWTRTPTVAEFDQLLRQCRDHLTRERGLAVPTVAGYQTVARQFLAHVASSIGFDLAGLDAAVVSQFVVRAGQTRCIGSTKHLVTGLRSLLRFLHLAGLSPALSGSLPAVSGGP